MGKKEHPIEIRPANYPRDYSGCVSLQRSVWKFSDQNVIPADMLRTVQRFGGILLVADTTEKEIAGFVFSFPAPGNRPPAQHSHMLAVQHDFRNAGIGFRLKQSQREAARLAGCKLLTWTFDPLEAKNAYLNLNKLGAVVRRYYPDVYGETSSELHQGIGTDRFLAEWRIDKAAGGGRQRRASVRSDDRLLLRGTIDSRGLLRPVPVTLNSNCSVILVEIPFNIQDLKQHDPKLALQWRRVTREIFTHYLDRGYEIRNVDRSAGSDRVLYCLKKADEAA